jgi:hypothetical protein
MTNRFRCLTLVLILASGFQNLKESENEPLYFTMNNEWREVTLDEEKFSFLGLDSLINHSVRLLSETSNEPRLFYCDLETSVCADGECRLASIKVYWNLIGNYVGYGIHNEDPLTKYDHDPFEREDYEKLHQLLLDNNSILRRKTMYDLVDKVPIDSISKNNSNNIDGLSSGTKKEIASAVVKGGLYSCYTLWHLVHGEVKQLMNSYLESIESDSLRNYFLYSDYQDYQLYALKQLSKNEFEEHAEQIGKIFLEAQSITRTYILKKMPDNALKNITSEIYRMFPLIGINSRTQLINRLNAADTEAVEFLKANPDRLNSKIESQLKEAGNSQELVNSYLIKDFFER